MLSKRIKIIVISGIIIICLSGCGKQEQNNNVDINLPNQSTITSETITESPTTETKKETTEVVSEITTEVSTESTENLEPNIKKEDISKADNYKTLLEEKNKLSEFINQLKLLQEDDLKENYDKYSLGTTIDTIVTDLTASKLRFINNVTLDYLYDENGSLIDMKDRKGLIVFSASDLSLSDEKNLLSNIDNYTKAKNEKTIIDVSGCDFDSFVVYTFNSQNQLVGKFKYLQTEENAKQVVDINKINGGLNFSDDFKLEIDENASVQDVYDKLDTTRELAEQYDKELTQAYKECFDSMKLLYDALNDNISSNDLGKMVSDNNLGIEKMPNVAIQANNDKYLKNNTVGYYVYMSLNQDQTSPDLRYSNNYLTVIFDNNDKIFYAEIVSDTYNDIKCENEKKADDYTLTQLYKEIAKTQSSIDSLATEKNQFAIYLENNIAILNKKISFDMTKESIISEIEQSGLDYEKNYENLAITNVKDSKGANISLEDSYGDKIYDDCIRVKSNEREILYYFNQGQLVGIYRNDYFDMAEETTSTYYNLTTIKKGLNMVLDKENSLLEEKQTYVNMVNKKLSDFMNSIGYADNHTSTQLYLKDDIIKALATTGFKYEEGMNKGDGLYYLGIYALDTDTKFAYKIYFNESLGVELIQ